MTEKKATKLTLFRITIRCCAQRGPAVYLVYDDAMLPAEERAVRDHLARHEEAITGITAEIEPTFFLNSPRAAKLEAACDEMTDAVRELLHHVQVETDHCSGRPCCRKVLNRMNEAVTGCRKARHVDAKGETDEPT